MKLFQAKSLTDIVNDPKNQEKSLQVFGDYIRENELSIIFGDTNSCKSLLTGDIALSVICNHATWEGHKMSELPLGTQVLYYDLEMSERQVAERYQNMDLPADSFVRISFTPTTYGQAELSDLYGDILERTDGFDKPVVLVLDNMQCFVQNVQNVASVGGFMDTLKNLLSIRKNLTIIVVGHCIKRNLSKPLTENDLAGSKIIANKADVIIGISKSCQGPDMRYVKMVKNRNRKRIDGVAELEISNEPYLHLELIGWGDEDEHLKKSKTGRPGLADEQRKLIIDLASQCKSCREIAEIVNISKSTVNRVILGQI